MHEIYYYMYIIISVMQFIKNSILFCIINYYIFEKLLFSCFVYSENLLLSKLYIYIFQ